MVEADRGARALRAHWGLGIEPVASLVQVLEDRGVKVLASALGGIDGLVAHVRKPEGRPVPVVVVNSSTCAERQRFTIAHELGHMVLSPGRKVDAEHAANRFAGAFLMPAEALWSEVGKRRHSIGLGELRLEAAVRRQRASAFETLPRLGHLRSNAVQEALARVRSSRLEQAALQGTAVESAGRAPPPLRTALPSGLGRGRGLGAQSR